MDPAAARERKTIALVGLMGVGKTSIGRRLAAALGLPFRDADEEIERAAGCSVQEIFAQRGEAEFRDGERRVIARLLDEPAHVLATGGGAFVQPATRKLIQDKALSVWLTAAPDVLARRVSRKGNRPLLMGKDPLQALEELAAARAPAYAEADVKVEVGEGSHQQAVDAVLAALAAYEQKEAS
jgi:shikimate kinase